MPGPSLTIKLPDPYTPDKEYDWKIETDTEKMLGKAKGKLKVRVEVGNGDFGSSSNTVRLPQEVTIHRNEPIIIVDP